MKNVFQRSNTIPPFCSNPLPKTLRNGCPCIVPSWHPCDTGFPGFRLSLFVHNTHPRDRTRYPLPVATNASNPSELPLSHCTHFWYSTILVFYANSARTAHILHFRDRTRHPLSPPFHGHPSFKILRDGYPHTVPSRHPSAIVSPGL